MRLFFAIPLPEDVFGGLSLVQERLKAALGHGVGVSWACMSPTHDAPAHLTLAFLGEQKGESLPHLSELLHQLHIPPFSLTIDRLGAFPSMANGRVLWAGVAPEPRLEALAMALRDLLGRAGISYDAKPFHPHITLGRVKQGAALLPELPIAPIRFDVSEFCLFESCIGHGGAVHEVLARFLL